MTVAALALAIIDALVLGIVGVLLLARRRRRTRNVPEAPPLPPTDADSPRPETVARILQHLDEALELQIAAGESIDGKVFQLLAAVSVVIGLAAIGGRVTQPAHATAHRPWSVWLLIAAVAVYCVAAVAALSATWTRSYFVARAADKIWETYWDATPEDFEWATVEYIAKHYPKNEAIIRSKTIALAALVLATTAEVVLVGVYLIVTTA